MDPEPTTAVRYPRIEDPSNIRLIDPIARLLVPLAVKLRISANAISIAGLPVGAAAAAAYWHWQQPGLAIIGFLLTVLWLVFDSLDGMVARTTNTSSAFGRELDGICDHIVFIFLYIGLALSIGGAAICVLTFFGSLAHAIQASLYEAERDRFHRRMRGEPPAVAGPSSRNAAIRFYNWLQSRLDRASAPFDRFLAASPDRGSEKRAYVQRVMPIFALMLPLTQNMRLVALFAAYLVRRMPLFLWYELTVLTLWTALGIYRLRHAEKEQFRIRSA